MKYSLDDREIEINLVNLGMIERFGFYTTYE